MKFLEGMGKLLGSILILKNTWNFALLQILRQNKVLFAFTAIKTILVLQAVLYVNDAVIEKQMQSLRALQTNIQVIIERGAALA